MVKVKISFPNLIWVIERQLPDYNKILGNCKFFINENIKDCDYWFVLDNLLEPEMSVCAPENTVLITGEPPEIKDYNPNFTEQFNTVITCHPDIKAKNLILYQQGIPWHIGYNRENETPVKYYQDLKKETPQKEKLISVITSDKSRIKGHKKRYEFVMKLKEHFGEKLDLYGRGINPVSDKYDAIAPYKYHIAIENCSINDYWTEKLADSFLGNAYPIYYGCKNLEKYFPPESYSIIDIDDFDKSVAMIENVINQNLYEKNNQYLIEAKNLVLDKYNVFNLIYEYILNDKKTYSKKKKITLYPEFYPVDRRTEWEKFKHKPLRYIFDKIKQ